MNDSRFDGPMVFDIAGRKVHRVTDNALSELSTMTQAIRGAPKASLGIGGEVEPIRWGIMKPGQPSIEVPAGYLEAMLAEIRISRAYFRCFDEQLADFAMRGDPK